MRFYKNRQAEMLNRVSFLLKNEKNAISAKVPALKDFISEFIEKEKHLYAIQTGNSKEVYVVSMEKKSVKEAFADLTMKLLSVVKAANYRSKNKEEDPLHYTLWGLKKLPAAGLCKVYLDAEEKVKKIRNLQYYGLSPDDVHDAREYYKEFASKKNAPAMRKKQVAAKNKQLNDGIKECIAMLEQTIDPLMMMAAENNPTLTMNYKACRKALPKGQGRPSDAEAAYRKSRTPKAQAG